MIKLKRYFSLQISLLMGAGRLESSAPQNATDNKGFGRRLAVSRFSIFSVSSDQEKIGNIFFFFRIGITYRVGMDFDLLLMEFGEQVLMRTCSGVNQRH